MRRPISPLFTGLSAVFIVGVATAAPPAFAETAGPPVRRAAVKTPPAVKPGSVEEIKRLLASAPRSSDYPSAAKATLLDLAQITVRPDGSARTITRMTFKVFNERGRDAESEIKIPYNAAFEKVNIVRARTIKPNGTVVAVKPSDIRDHGLDAGDGTYTDARVKSFSMPAVSEDCILDYEYVTDQTASQMPGQFWTRWYFQSGLDPVLLSRLTIKAPKAMTLRENLRNSAVQPTRKNTPDGKSTVYVWESRNVSPLETEYMMPPPDSVLPKLALSTVPSWQSIADWYTRLARDRDTADAAIKATTQEVIKDKATPEEKARAIFYYVEEKVRYVAIELGIGAYQPRFAPGILENQYGDCKDMTTLLISMLREAGITAHPVLLQAGSKEKISDDLPSPGAFNHAICLAEIGGKKYWLDATAQFCTWGEVPGADRGAEAFVIRDGKGEWEVIPHAEPTENQMEQKVALTLNPDGSATGKVTILGTGDVDMQLRAQLMYLPLDRQRQFVEGMAQNIGPNAKVTRYEISNFRNKDVPIAISYDVTFPAWASKSGDLLFFKARPEQTVGAASSPFREEGRRHPITQTAAAQGRSLLEVTLPPGFSVLSMPQAAKVNSDLGRFEREVSMSGGKLTINTLGVNYRAFVPPSRYTEVQKYYDTYLSAANESVIIKKG